MVDFSKYKIKENLDKITRVITPDKEVFPEKHVVKITPGENNPKSNLTVKSHSESELIDKKLSEKINDRLLKLLKIGLKHELTIENMFIYFKEVEKAKLYELKRFFSDSPGYKIEKMLKFMYASRDLKKTKDNWYYLNPVKN